jgi:hypothetical protein
MERPPPPPPENQLYVKVRSVKLTYNWGFEDLKTQVKTDSNFWTECSFSL